MRKTMVSKFPGKCEVCGVAFPTGTQIVYNGRASHVVCVEAERERQAAEDREQEAFQARNAAEFKAGARVKSEFHALASGQEIIVRGAPSYEMARDETRAQVSSIKAAGGSADLLYTKRGGKKYLGREIRSGGYNGTMTYHEGWAFPCRVGVAA